MLLGHQASTDRAKTVPAQQDEGQAGPQQSQHLHTMALAVAVDVLTELCIAWPPPASGKLSTRFDPSTRGLTDDHENDL